MATVFRVPDTAFARPHVSPKVVSVCAAMRVFRARLPYGGRRIDHIKIVDEYDIVENVTAVSFATGRFNLTLCARPIGGPPKRQAFRGRYRVRPYHKAAFAVEHLAGLRSR